jgi:hypothetical protein
MNPFLLGSVGSLVVQVEGGKLAVVPANWGSSGNEPQSSCHALLVWSFTRNY